MNSTKLKIIIISILFLCFGLFLNAQNEVSGLVNDSEGLPIPGVTVIIEGTNLGTSTDFDGKYEITGNFSDTSILVFSYIGLKTLKKPLEGQTIINVQLEEDTEALEEVVIIGYGSQDKKDITGAVAVIDSKELEDRPNTQVAGLLQGKAAGVQVISNSGKPSGSFSIRIRGAGSIGSGTDPLYVVDGVPTTDTRAINPADIESITVLKDAASAAIYGTQAAGGVVLITTKKGTTAKPKVTLDFYTGISQVWNTLPVLNGEQYRDLMTELGLSTNWELYQANTDWQDKIFQDGVSRNYQFSVSGKTKATNYYVSAGFTDVEGAVRSSELDRTNFKINLDQEVNSWFKVGTRFAYTKYSDVDVLDNTNVNSGGVLLGALTTPSVIGVYNEDGTFTSNPFQNWENPLASTDGLDRGFSSERFLANIYAELTLAEGLVFKTNFGVDNNNGTFDSFLDPFRTSFGQALGGRAINATNKSSYRIFDNTLSYKNTFNRHKIEGLVGFVTQNYLFENTNIETQNFASDAVTTPNGGSLIIAANAGKAEKANASFISRINYSFEDKYLLTANFRADGSSIFGPNNRYGYFPSVSLGWRLSREHFLKNIDFLNDLKLRAGWGIVGNDQFENYAYFGLVGSGANYPIGGVPQPGTFPSTIENRSLKWEETEQRNIGIDLSFFNRRIDITADAYVKNTSDLLLRAPLPTATGFNSAIQNIGEIENRGLEFSINTTNINNENFSWTSNFNISFNENEVISLAGQELLQGSIAGRGEASLVREGEALGSLYGYIFGGVDPATGNAYYIDTNGNSTFTPSPDDRVIIGDANPDFFYAFTNTFNYKGFGLNIFLQGSQGNDVLNATRIETEGLLDPKNQSIAVLNRWRNPGDITDIPRATFGNSDNSRISTRFIEDGSYLRFKAVTLSYNFPDTLLNQLKLSALKLYATGENLITITDYSGFDPEVNAFGGSSTVRGVDFGTYPQTRNLIFGVNVAF